MRTRLTSLALALSLAGCVQPPASHGPLVAPISAAPTLGPTQAPGSAPPRPTASPGTSSQPSTTPATTPAPTPVPVPVTERTTSDRPDDTTDFQVHLLYVLPAGADDEHLDTDGTVARSVMAANSWLVGQTPGAKLRIDTYQGVPDVTFFRSSHTQAELSDSTQRIELVKRELQEAGFLDPLKVYAAYYGGGSAIDEQTIELGIGGGGMAMVFIKQCGSCALASSPTQPNDYEFAFVHEVLHALGFVPACAPHVSGDSHVTDDPHDVMSAVTEGGVPVLDAHHDDYYQSNIAGCLDLARSPFLDPTPAKVDAPTDRPLARAAGPDAVPFAPALTLAGTPGDAGTEDALLVKLNALRAAKGKPPLASDDTLKAVARQAIPNTAGGFEALLAKAGYGSNAGFDGLDFLGGSAEALAQFDTSTAFADLATVDATAAGVGVTLDGSVAHVHIVYGAPELKLEAVSIGSGPLSSLTVAARVSGRDETATIHGRVFVDRQPYTVPFIVRPHAPLTVTASIPMDGKPHTVALGLADGADDEHYLFDQELTVDPTRPLDQALSFAH